MKALSSHFFTLILMVFSLKLSAQSNIFHLPENLPQPDWYAKVDWSKPNVFFIDSVIREYKKNEIPQIFNEEEEEEFEEPYETAYIRWRLQRLPYIQPNGNIVIDSTYYYRTFQNTNTSNRSINLGGWTPLGPIETFRQGVGEKLNYQCNITATTISASNPNIIFAGSETGVVFKSSDKGNVWAAVNDEIAGGTGGVTAIGIDPVNSNRVLYYNPGGLFLSLNGGSSFARLNNYNYGEINRIVINSSTGRIVVASLNGIYYSDDSGASWMLSAGTSSNEGMYDLVQKPGQPIVLYACGAQNTTGYLLLYLSTNGGASFTSITMSGGTNLLTSTGARLAVTQANSSYVYCVSLQNSPGPVIIRSTNSGSGWTVMSTSTSTSLAGSNQSTGLGMSNGQGYYDLDIAVSYLNPNDVIVGSTTTYKSTDGGINFTPLGGYFGTFTGKIHPDMQMIQQNGSDTYISTDGGIAYSNDFFTTNISVINYGLVSSLFWGFGQGWDKDIVVGGRYHNGDGVIFENYGAGNATYLGGGEDATGHVFHGRENTVGFRDIGTKVVPNIVSGTVTNASIGNTVWPQDDYYGNFASKLMIDPRYSFIYYTGKDSTLWKSTNNGASYTTLKKFNSRVWRFDISRSNPNVIYVCTQSGGIQKTIDGGLTWSSVLLPAGVTYQYYQSDIAISHTNENEVYFCMKNGSAANKVFKTTNGGVSWTNITGATLNGKSVAYILYHGNNGAIYAITAANASEVFVKDNSMTDWALFSSGLPKNLLVWGGCGIFFRDNKLRTSSTRGVWQSTLNSNVIPVAQPMADKSTIGCSSDTVYFSDYSILNYSGASWQWSFPGASYVSSYTVRNPKVVYPTIGNYHVTLTVTDALGQSNSKTINNMISFQFDNCKADTLAGKSLILKGTNTPIELGTANINSNTFSLSCWIKPNGNQNSFAQLISHDPYPGSSYGFGLGFSFSGYTPNLKLCYTDNLVGYGNASSLLAVSQKWNFVVLTYSPTGVYIYLNGKKELVNGASMPAINLSLLPFYINRDIHNQGGYYNGEIDEVKIYNYTLTENEVRQKMHLIPRVPLSETGLIKYCQFNNYNPENSTAYELKNNFRMTIPDSSYINNNSEVPVGPGSVYTISNLASGGLKDFTGLGMKLYFKNFTTGITYPNGDLVGFRLNIPPYTKPDTRKLEPDSSWFIINNYGTNVIFSSLDSMRFENLDITPGNYTAGNFKLFKRASISHGVTWETEQDSSDVFVYNASTQKSNVTFSTANNITSFSQFAMVGNKAPSYAFIGNGNWDIASNWLNNIVPPSTLEEGLITINPIASGSCVLNIRQIINPNGKLAVTAGKSFKIQNNLIFQ